MDRTTYVEMYYNLIATLMTRQLMLGQPAVIDCLVTDGVGTRWREIAAAHGAELAIVECICSDIDLHRSRIARARLPDSNRLIPRGRQHHAGNGLSHPPLPDAHAYGRGTPSSSAEPFRAELHCHAANRSLPSVTASPGLGRCTLAPKRGIPVLDTARVARAWFSPR